MFLTALVFSPKRKQKYQNGNIHRKLGVPTSEREGKLSNPRARATRPPCMGKIYRNLQKPARALHARAMHWFCSSQKHSTKALPASDKNQDSPTWPSDMRIRVAKRSNFQISRISLWNFRNFTRIHGGDAPLAAFNAYKCCWNGSPPRRSVVGRFCGSVVCWFQICARSNSRYSRQVLSYSCRYILYGLPLHWHVLNGPCSGRWTLQGSSSTCQCKRKPFKNLF